MNVIFISSLVIALTVIIGVLLSAIAGWFGRLVLKEQTAALKEREHYNQNLTLGLEIPFDTDQEDQLRTARILAAKKAASMPRGGNMRIGTMGVDSQLTAFDGVKEDPVSAVKIAAYHGWEGVRSGIISSDEASAAVRAPAQSTESTKGVDDLVAGVDYPFIEITEDMSPAEKRKARIANSKARSTAVKSLKDSGQTAAAPAASSIDSTKAAGAGPAVPSSAGSGAVAESEPVAGVDYLIIEITDEMDPAEARSARIANSKARSAAMKAYKQAGGGSTLSVSQVTEPMTEEPAEDVVADSPSTVAVPADVPQPNYIEISEDMDPDEVRQARIHNSKERSAYNRALKAAGIDPSSL